MKYFIVTLCAVFSVTVNGLTGQLVGAAEPPSINQADIDVLSEADTSLVELLAVFENDQATLEEFKAAAQDTQAKLDTAAKHSFVTELGSEYTRTADVLKSKAATLKTSLEQLVVAYEAGDEVALSTRHDAFSTALDEYEAAFFAFDDSISGAVAEEQTTSVVYLVALVVTGVVAVASFVWAFVKKAANKQLQSAKTSVAINSLWPLGGAAVTYVSYYLAQSGDTYTIAWGAILIGAVFFAKSLFDYFALRKQLTAAQA